MTSFSYDIPDITIAGCLRNMPTMLTILLTV